MVNSLRYCLDIKNIGIEDAIKEAIEADEELVTALIGDPTRFDQRATYVDDSFIVEAVEFGDKNQVYVSIAFDWEAYYGCKDLCKEDNYLTTVTGHINGGKLVFEILETEPRNTVEEF